MFRRIRLSVAFWHTFYSLEKKETRTDSRIVEYMKGKIDDAAHRERCNSMIEDRNEIPLDLKLSEERETNFIV